LWLNLGVSLAEAVRPDNECECVGSVVKGVFRLEKSDPAKATCIKAYFDDLNKRIENLADLNALDCFRDDALILCLVYIDGLASNYYEGREVNKNFCRALRELSGNALFGKIHAKFLLDPDNDKYWAGGKTDKDGAKAKFAVEGLASRGSGDLLDELEVAGQIRSSGVGKEMAQRIVSNLWRSSIAAICYEEMRNGAVHRLGTKTLTFGETFYEGRLGFKLNFDVLHRALRHISDHIAKESVVKGEWFARKDYFKPR